MILSLSSDQAEAMLKDIESRLKSGSTVLDCWHLSASTLRSASENLGPDRHYLARFRWSALKRFTNSRPAPRMPP